MPQRPDDPHPAGAHRSSRLLRTLRRPAVLGVAFASVLAGASTAAASDWFQVFQSRSDDPVIRRAPDLIALPDLEDYGEVEVTGDLAIRDVADAETATARSGLAAPMVAPLPRGVTGEPVYKVAGRASLAFTFSAERAQRMVEASGSALPPPPPELDGARVDLAVGPAVAAVWSQPSGIPRLVVARTAPPVVTASGVSWEVMVEYLLTIPGLPDDITSQLRTFDAGDWPLGLPTPVGEMTFSVTDVDGSPATVAVTADRSIAAVVWVDEEVVTFVAGSLDADEILSVARSLG